MVIMQTLANVPTENEFQRKAVLEADTSVRTSCGCRRQKKKKAFCSTVTEWQLLNGW